MTRRRRRRENAKHRKVIPAPAGESVDDAAGVADYTGSTDHKDMPSFAGPRGTPSPDATVCPRELAGRREELVEWLRQAIRAGHVGRHWQNGFPRYAWVRRGSVVYEARLTGNGCYHGYPLEPWENVRGLP